MTTLNALGVLGCGPMGTAIIEGALRSGLLQASQVTAVDRDQARCDAMAALGAETERWRGTAALVGVRDAQASGVGGAVGCSRAVGVGVAGDGDGIGGSHGGRRGRC